MKTILELSVNHKTFYEMPEWLYDIFDNSLENYKLNFLIGKVTCRKLYKMLPPELQKLIKIKKEKMSYPEKIRGNEGTIFIDNINEGKI